MASHFVRSRPAPANKSRWTARRLVALFAIVTFVPLGLLTYLAVSLGGDAITSEVRSKVATSATLEARAVQQRVRGVEILVAAYATRPQIVAAINSGHNGSPDIATLQSQMDQLEGTDPGLALASVLDPAGRLLVLAPASPSIIGVSYAYRDWYSGVTRTGATYVSTAYRTAAPGNPLVVAVSAPIRVGGGAAPAPVIGYLTVGYRLDAIQQFVEQFARSEAVTLSVTDQAGVILAGPGVGSALTSAASQVMVRRALAGQSGVVDWTGSRGRALVGFAPVSTIGWTVHADVLRSEALKRVAGLRVAVTACGSALAVFLGLALLMLSRSWTRRFEAEAASRHHEGELAQAQAAAHLGSWKLDTRAGIVSWSAELYRLLGCEDDGRIVTRADFVARVHPDDLGMLDQAERSAVESGDSFTLDHRIVTPTGTVRWLQTRGAVDHVEAGGVVLRGTSIDITDRKDAEARIVAASDALSHANTDLLASNQELEQFAYVASHDLSEPLRAISGPITLLARKYQGQIDSEADTYIEFAVDGCQRMQTIISDLLTYSRIGRIEGSLGPVDCNIAVAAAMQGLRQLIEETGAEITVDTLPTVRAEAAQLIQVFQNLLSNGMKFHRSEVPPRIHVCATRQGSLWEFSVVDNGIGVEPEHRDRIFGMFKRLHSRAEYPGTGIGLALAKKIVERHGGAIGMTDADTGGSRFWFTLDGEEIT